MGIQFKLSYFRFSYYILVFFMLHLPVKAASWPEECDLFVVGKLKVLRETRSLLKRPDFQCTQANEILEFIEQGKQHHGTKTVSATHHFAELIVDICDIVNLQHPNFKTRYDVFIEQWDGNTQLPFSLFSFDRVAQVFHYRQTLFNLTDGSAYRQMVDQILEREIPVLRNAFVLIDDLDAMRQGKPIDERGIVGYADDLKVINTSLDQLSLVSGGAKAQVLKAIKGKVPPQRMRGLCSLSSMAHDYLTLGRIEDAVKVILDIPAFTNSEQREAFLAGMIQIGELATNKNLSRFVRHSMPTIPWEELVHCRDAIEHQDEHGFDAYFAGLVDGSNTSVNFKDWQEELKILAKRVSDAKLIIWTNDAQGVFEIWLQNELLASPLYGVVKRAEIVSLDSAVKKVFRQTSLFNGGAELWGKLINGTVSVSHACVGELVSKINDLKNLIPTLTNSTKKTEAQKFLASYESVETYLWDRLRREAVHLSVSERNLLISTAIAHFKTPDIVNFCFALLNMHQAFLTVENTNRFVHTSLANGLDFRTISPIFSRFRPEMLVTRHVRQALPFDNTKDLAQAARRDLAKRMFVRTSHHLHELAHGPNFEARMMQEMTTIPARFAYENLSPSDPKVIAFKAKSGELHNTYGVVDEYGYVNLNPEGLRIFQHELIQSGLRFNFPKKITPKFLTFGNEVMERFYRSAHTLQLGAALQNNAVTYLASVYSLSVGIGALKEWTLREAVPPIAEITAVEKLRDGRNFIAHGDILRSMNSVNLADVQVNLLTNHLDHCAILKFKG